MKKEKHIAVGTVMFHLFVILLTAHPQQTHRILQQGDSPFLHPAASVIPQGRKTPSVERLPATRLSYIMAGETQGNGATAREKPNPAKETGDNNSAHTAACYTAACFVVMLKPIPCVTIVHFQ